MEVPKLFRAIQVRLVSIHSNNQKAKLLRCIIEYRQEEVSGTQLRMDSNQSQKIHHEQTVNIDERIL